MRSFVQRHQTEIKGVLSGFDRLRFRGTLRWLSSIEGMGSFLGTIRVLLMHFNDWAQLQTDRIRTATARLAQSAGRPVVYLASSQTSKEETALEIAAEDGIREGLVAVLSCVEPCYSFRVGPNREKRRLELRYGPMKCLHYYFYVLHRRLGLMHLRLQSWAPFTIHVGLNGRQWLAQQLAAEGIAFEQRDNCFVDLSDPRRAQALLDSQLRTNWTRLLNGLVRRFHPAHAALLFGEQPLAYYWSAEETEWATDVMFRSQQSLARLYPRWLAHAMTTFGSTDVLRFLGQAPYVRQSCTAEITSALKKRPEGVCVKHARNRNSVKMYDKQQTVLRVETTINNSRELKVLRPLASDPKRKRWQCLRKGVADLHRRAQLSQQSNERYLEALATVDESTSLAEAVQPLCKPTRWKGRGVRGLQPFQHGDAKLLAAISRGEFLISGFRNADLRPLLFGAVEVSRDEQRRQSARVTRLIRMLRAHGLVRKIPKTHRYQLTPHAHAAITALTAAQQATIKTLTQLAA